MPETEACDLPSLVLRAALTQQGTPPRLRSAYLLQVPRPEQPIAPVCKAHVYDYVLFPPVATHNLADQASSFLYPVVVLHLHSHAHACILRLHDYQRNAPGRAEKYMSCMGTSEKIS